MAEATVEVRNPSGLHARPAATFVKAAAGFKSDVRVTNRGLPGSSLTPVVMALISCHSRAPASAGRSSSQGRR